MRSQSATSSRGLGQFCLPCRRRQLRPDRRPHERTRTSAPAAIGADLIPPEEAELAASVLANSSPHPLSMFDRSERRWIEIPDEDSNPDGINLADHFHVATGAPLEDLRMIGLALHGRAVNRIVPPRVKQNYLEKLNLGADRLPPRPQPTRRPHPPTAGLPVAQRK